MMQDGQVTYILKDPFTRAVRYVGVTICLSHRIYGHVGHAKSGIGNQEKNAWINRLVKRGRLPIGEIIAFENIEREAIIKYRNAGCKLFNKHLPRAIKLLEPKP